MVVDRRRLLHRLDDGHEPRQRRVLGVLAHHVAGRPQVPPDLGVVVRRPLRARRARARLGRARGRPGDERLERERLARESWTPPREHRGVMETLATTGTPEPPDGSEGKGASVEFVCIRVLKNAQNAQTGEGAMPKYGTDV